MEFSLPARLPFMSVKAPDPVLYRALQKALNASFAAHSEFLPWAKPCISEDEAERANRQAKKSPREGGQTVVS